MIRYFSMAIYAALLTVMVPSFASAQSNSNEDYLKAAEPYMNLSCQALVDTYGDDEEQMEQIVTVMVAVSVINREIDITKLLESDTDKDEFGEFLEAALTEQCQEDVDSLLAGNVDRAVAYAFTDDGDKKQPPELGHSSLARNDARASTASMTDVAKYLL